MLTAFLQLTFFSLSITQIVAQTSYANDFVDPDYILAGNFPSNTGRSQRTITNWASKLALGGPWSVMNKAGTPPSGTKHDYMSWAPYWWPDCSNVGNTTALSDEEVWKTCPYKNRDGQFNPDVRTVNDVGAFQDFSDAVLYNTIAWALTKVDSYSEDAVKFIRTWFLDEATKMNPNLNYAQMQRGPTGQTGSHAGILDLKCMAKIASGILILRKGKSAAWTSALDTQMISWSREYINWLETADIAVEEGNAANNHGTFYYNQLAALKLIVNDLEGAKEVTTTFFSKQYPAQIDANGEQPLEASRTRPYHYRAYNLAAMITNARIAKYADPSSNVWNKTSSSGATIKTALDFVMTISAGTSGETSYANELYPDLAAVAAVYGDPDGKYLTFLKQADPAFYEDGYFLWNQPWAQFETGGTLPTTSSRSSSSRTSKAIPTSKGTSTSTNKSSSNVQESGVSRMLGGDLLSASRMLVVVVLTFLVFLQ